MFIEGKWSRCDIYCHLLLIHSSILTTLSANVVPYEAISCFYIVTTGQTNLRDSVKISKHPVFQDPDTVWCPNDNGTV